MSCENMACNDQSSEYDRAKAQDLYIRKLETLQSVLSAPNAAINEVRAKELARAISTAFDAIKY